jgi:hypothetical protein
MRIIHNTGAMDLSTRNTPILPHRQSAIRGTIYTIDSIPLLLLFALSRPLALTIIDHVSSVRRDGSLLTLVQLYDTYEPTTNILHLHLFASGLLIHVSVFLVERFFSFNISSPSYHTSANSSRELIQAGVDLASLAIIYGESDRALYERILMQH